MTMVTRILRMPARKALTQAFEASLKNNANIISELNEIKQMAQNTPAINQITKAHKKINDNPAGNKLFKAVKGFMKTYATKTAIETLAEELDLDQDTTQSILLLYNIKNFKDSANALSGNASSVASFISTASSRSATDSGVFAVSFYNVINTLKKAKNLSNDLKEFLGVEKDETDQKKHKKEKQGDDSSQGEEEISLKDFRNFAEKQQENNPLWSILLRVIPSTSEESNQGLKQLNEVEVEVQAANKQNTRRNTFKRSSDNNPDPVLEMLNDKKSSRELLEEFKEKINKEIQYSSKKQKDYVKKSFQEMEERMQEGDPTGSVRRIKTRQSSIREIIAAKLEGQRAKQQHDKDQTAEKDKLSLN